MPYVDTNFKEGTLLSDFGNILEPNGWTKVKTFKKVAYEDRMINPQARYQTIDNVPMGVGRHVIYKNSAGTYYGVCKIYSFTTLYKDLPVKPVDDITKEPELKQWIADKYKDFGKENALYFYMCDQVPDVEDNGVYGCAVDDDIPLERGMVDIETSESVVVNVGAGLIFQYTKFDANIQQSPFTKVSLRNPNLTKTDVATNWWADSLVRVKGFVDSQRVVLVMQADSTPAFMNNVVPSVPLFLGTFTSFKEGDTGNQAIMGGSALDTGGDETASHKYDFKSTTPLRKTSDCMPLQKTYPSYPGNGVDNVIVKRGELGSRYQAYYLSWSTAPQAMAPDRVGKDGGQYPLAWNNAENDEYKYKFNPSVYSNKIHTSRAYLVHPDEGVRGYLPKMVLLSPFGLVNEDKLKVRTGTCPDTFDIYRFFLPSAISPLSKRPGTVYTPAGMGIFQESI